MQPVFWKKEAGENKAPDACVVKMKRRGKRREIINVSKRYEKMFNEFH